MAEPLTQDELRRLITRLIHSEYNRPIPVNLRTRGGSSDLFGSVLEVQAGAVQQWVNIDDLMLFLTKLSEEVIDDTKQMAYRGLRDLLEAIKHNQLSKPNEKKK